MKPPVNRGDLLKDVRVEEMTLEGQGVVRIDRYVVFVNGGVPGDVADIQIDRIRKKHAEGSLQRISQRSPHRTDPSCKHFGTCGGCRMQHITYDWQLDVKQRAVADAFERIGKLTFQAIEPIIGSRKTYGYRNRLDFTCASRRWLTRDEIDSGAAITEPALGFHVPGRFDKVLDIETCHLQDGLSNVLRREVRSYAIEQNIPFFDTISQDGMLRNLIVRSSSIGEIMVVVVFKEENQTLREGLLDHIAHKFPEITSLQYIINGKRNDTIFDQEVILHKGRNHIFEEMEQLKFKISAKSFYQTNSDQAYVLYKTARDLAQLTGSENVYDLYTGTGTIALFIARSARHVAGIDYIEDAILDARENAVRNGISNVAFEAGDLKDRLNSAFIEKYGRPDVIVTDPPRSGMHPDVVKKLIELKPQRIVYVSCNPTTQARDLQSLEHEYQIGKIQPVDMFPHTMHVENVVLLHRRT